MPSTPAPMATTSPYQIFTIKAEDLPSKAFSIGLKEPTFADRREVSRRFPSNGKVSYSLEELLLASCIVQVNEQDVSSAPRDPLQILKELPNLDEQFLLSLFLSMFTLDNDLAETAKNMGLSMKTQLNELHTIPKSAMPLQEFSLSFRSPLLVDRMEANNLYPGADSNCGYSLEELLFAMSLTAIDGQPLERSKNPIALLDQWKHIDTQFAVAVFINTVTIDSDDSQKAKSLGKSLRAGMKQATTPAPKTAAARPKDTATPA